MRSLSWMSALVVSGILVSAAAADGPITYPPTQRVEHVDEYHGVKVADPYRWLEDDVRKSRMLIDPNTWSKDGTVALGGTAISDDGKYVAYGIAGAGSDWRTWRVLHVDSGKVLDDELKWVKFSNASWTRDGKGFFYSR